MILPIEFESVWGSKRLIELSSILEMPLKKNKKILPNELAEEVLLHAVHATLNAWRNPKKSQVANQLSVLYFFIHAVQQKHFGKVLIPFQIEYESSKLAKLPAIDAQLVKLLSIDWPKIDVDVFGAVYNKIISQLAENQHGQHFTDVDEVDIICAFCLHAQTKTILDSAVGAGAFLVRAQRALPNANIYGVEIDATVAQLALFNLQWRKKKEATILHRNFADVTPNELPQMDAIIGNPPYIRQEEMVDKTKWLKLSKAEWSISKINAQCDLYVYYLMHTAYYLKEGGRLGYVISASWLDNAFGATLQHFLLQHFKIIAIIDQQAERSFETASVNSVVLIIEKCSDAKQRAAHAANFVRLKKPYAFFIGSENAAKRKQQLSVLVQSIEQPKNKKYEAIEIFSITQKDLLQTSLLNNKFHNGHWGAKYLRSSNIYTSILNKVGKHFMPLQKMATVRYGIKTGANDFFYLQDKTSEALSLVESAYTMRFGFAKDAHKYFWKTHGWFYSSLLQDCVVIERKFVQPVFKSQREASNLLVQKDELQFVVLNCEASKAELLKMKSPLLQYIQTAEEKYKVNEVASVQGRKHWYDLSASMHVGEFIFPSKIGDRYRLMDNREAKVFCDKVNYVVQVHTAFQKYADIILLLLNSICFRFFVELFARQLTGSQTLSDVDVQVVANTLLPNPQLFAGKKKRIQTLLNKLQNRPQLSIFEEVKMNDRLALERMIFETLGLSEKEMKALLDAAIEYVQKRNEKSASLKKVMLKK